MYHSAFTHRFSQIFGYSFAMHLLLLIIYYSCCLVFVKTLYVANSKSSTNCINVEILCWNINKKQYKPCLTNTLLYINLFESLN